MNPQRFRSIMTAELSQLRREGLLDESTFDTLSERYSPTQWNWASMGRWFAIFGGLCTAAGICIVAADLFEMTLRNLAWALTLTTAALLWGGYRLKQSRMKWTALSLEMCASLAIIGLTFTLGIIFSTGSGNWPMLLLIDLFVLLPLAYLLRNVLVLIVTAVVFFTWFGGMTGYVSGWGAYWFGMNYPMRFLLAGILIALIGVLHRQAESGWLRQYRNFFKVWLSSGVFFANMALWLMSLFGNFSTIYGRHLETGRRTGDVQPDVDRVQCSPALSGNSIWSAHAQGLWCHLPHHPGLHAVFLEGRRSHGSGAGHIPGRIGHPLDGVEIRDPKTPFIRRSG